MKKIVVLPAYNAVRTLRDTVAPLPRGASGEILPVDDCSAAGA